MTTESHACINTEPDSPHRCPSTYEHWWDHGDGPTCRHVDRCALYRGHEGLHTDGRSTTWRVMDLMAEVGR